MKLFRKPKPNKNVMFEDLLTLKGDAVGVFRLYFIVDENGRDSLKNVPGFFSEVVRLAYEKYQIRPSECSSCYNDVESPLAEGSAILATYTRDDNYRERLCRRLEKFLSRKKDQ